MPHILRPDPGKTLQQTFENQSYKNDRGNTECVTFIEKTLRAPGSKTWREGKKVVKGDRSIATGTAIATFVNGKFPDGSSGQHAAIYLDQDALGIVVLDQWRSQGYVKKRTIHWTPKPPAILSNDGNAFSVIEW